jgi:ribonuclease HI
MSKDEIFKSIRDPAGTTRQFTPNTNAMYIYTDITSELVCYNTKKEVLQLRHRRLPTFDDLFVEEYTMVVYIAVACRSNGGPEARASYGIYFGPKSRYNGRGLLHYSSPQTSTRAEIVALKQALGAISTICANDHWLKHIKIATDSEFLFNVITNWIYQWVDDNGVKSDGTLVMHFELLKDIHEQWDHMRSSDGGGIQCQLWKVDRERNREADALANSALDRS